MDQAIRSTAPVVPPNTGSYNGKASIVLDPSRSFGQPIATDCGVPTVVLADAVRAEGTVARVARPYAVDPRVVRDAVRFEASLLAA